MSFVKGGITYYDPDDLTVVTLASAEGILSYIGAEEHRTLKSQIASALHDHSGQIIKPNRIDFGTAAGKIQSLPGGYLQNIVLDAGSGRTSLVTQGATYFLFSWHGGGSGIKIFDSYMVIGSATAYPAYGITLVNSDTKGSGLAYAWNTWASSEEWKTDIEPIKDPKLKLNNISGITYKQDGREGAGITAEDLESTGIPGAVVRDPKTDEFVGIDVTKMIPLLVEAVKALSQEVDSLKSEIRKGVV